MPESSRRTFSSKGDPRLSVKRTTRPIPGAQFAAGEAAPTEEIATLEGYPIVWNAVSTDRGGYQVRLMPNSATFAQKTLALWHHDPARVLGTTANTTLRIAPDAYGVRVSIDLPDTSDGRDAEELVENGYVTGMSFAMVTAPDGEMVTEGDASIFNATRYLVDEVTITATPAFVETEIKVAQDNVPEDGYAAKNAAEELRFEKLKFDFLTL